MSFDFYNKLKLWRQAREERKTRAAAPQAEQKSPSPTEPDARVYAAGIACAAQSRDRPR